MRSITHNARLRWATTLIVAIAISPPALADLTGTISLPAGSAMSVDTGASAPGGDVAFTGTSILIQNGAGASYPEAVNLNERLSSLEIGFADGGWGQAPITAALLAVNNGFWLHSSEGNFAVVLITALSSSSVTLQYHTYCPSGPTGCAPSISAIQNNSSFLWAGQPNYGIAPGSLFVIKGSSLAAYTPPPLTLQSSAAPGLPASLNESSVAVTINGVTTSPAFYYATPTQLALELPSGTPVGTGNVVVTYNGTPSAATQIQVVPTAVGLDTAYGYGTGMGLATDNTTGVLLGYLNSGAPGETIDLWGTGLGAEPVGQ